MSNSILDTVKSGIGIHETDSSFDASIIMSINATLSIISKLGFGPSEGVRITSSADRWDLLIGKRTDCEFIKEYVAMKVKMIFDPPVSSAASQSLNNLIKEFEWRIRYM